MSDSITVTKGVHHIGLTVPDLKETQGFFLDTLGYQQLGEMPDYPAVFVSDGHTMITLWQAKDPSTAAPRPPQPDRPAPFGAGSGRPGKPGAPVPAAR